MPSGALHRDHRLRDLDRHRRIGQVEARQPATARPRRRTSQPVTARSGSSAAVALADVTDTHTRPSAIPVRTITPSPSPLSATRGPSSDPSRIGETPNGARENWCELTHPRLRSMLRRYTQSRTGLLAGCARRYRTPRAFRRLRGSGRWGWSLYGPVDAGILEGVTRMIGHV